MLRRVGLPVVVLAVLGTVGYVIYARMIPVVEVAAVRWGPVVQAVYATGVVEPRDHAVLKSRAQGPLDNFTIREGSAVQAGQVLMTVDSPMLRHELELAQASLAEAQRMAAADSPLVAELKAQIAAQKANLDKAVADRERVRRLEAKGSAASMEITETQANLDRANSLLTSLRSALDRQEVEWQTKLAVRTADVQRCTARYAECQARSPMAGVVLQRFVEPGEVVAINQPLVEVGDIRDLILTAQVDEQDMADLAVGQQAEVRLYAFAQPLRATIYDIFPDADRVNKTFTMKLSFLPTASGPATQPDLAKDPVLSRLKSGMTGEVYVVTARKERALIIPSRAVSSDGRVFVVNGSHLAARKVELGLRSLLTTEVLGGLADGDRVLVGGLSTARDGQRVRPLEIGLTTDPLTEK